MLIRALRFANDQAMLANREEDSQPMMVGLNSTTKEYQMKIKTKRRG